MQTPTAADTALCALAAATGVASLYSEWSCTSFPCIPISPITQWRGVTSVNGQITAIDLSNGFAVSGNLLNIYINAMSICTY